MISHSFSNLYLRVENQIVINYDLKPFLISHIGVCRIWLFRCPIIEHSSCITIVMFVRCLFYCLHIVNLRIDFNKVLTTYFIWEFLINVMIKVISLNVLKDLSKTLLHPFLFNWNLLNRNIFILYSGFLKTKCVITVWSWKLGKR